MLEVVSFKKVPIAHGEQKPPKKPVEHFYVPNNVPSPPGAP